ncbi:MAG: ABC transporter permease [Deltaproteobacteria bacterium]|nr:ABC transporter permease [Deltaproteobacteria bacterium]MBW2253470.1 ABC transporter permease [Deltaproteobacteria bacterium]
MIKYILRKLLLAIPLLWGVVTIIFFLIELSPGSVADHFFTPETTPEVREMIIAKYGLDQPAFFRYLLMLRNLAMLDFGHSMVQERPVFDMVMEALPNTLILSAVTLMIIFPTGILLGTVQGVRQGRPVDTGISIGSLFFYSMPSFWLALMLQLIFTMHWKLLPTSGMYDMVWYDSLGFGGQLWDRALHLVLPGLAMGLAAAAGTARYMRSSLLEVIRQDYIRTARAKGLPERVVIGKHALRNALLPIITLMGLSLPFLFSGSVLVETIFAWPGMGRLIVNAIFAQDTPTIVACFFVFTLVVVAGNLIADLMYAVIDPRIQYD